MVEKIFAVPQPNVTEGTELTYYANDDKLVVTSDTALTAQGPGYRVRSSGFVARADGSEVQLVGGVAGRISGGGR